MLQVCAWLKCKMAVVHIELQIVMQKNISLVPSWREITMEPLQEEDAVDIPEVRVSICIIYIYYT